MGKRSRRRGGEDLPSIPDAEYTLALADGGSIQLRCVMSLKTREQYAKAASGLHDRPGAAREDAWQRSVEFLFERLVNGWTVAGVEYREQKELLMRFRVASSEERAAVRTAMREHLAEWFPDMEAP
ncbi:MAG: hypothetical protein F2799_02015 [Actinobacteria bacterium]|uniref:Unannotated protein n=1 Tax=freshwater metagenome TaxID=449393 RepID=A0A6J7DCV3_9ZZZZ|nr:hypothetical protein [Actinomycetota bacterium]